MQSVASQFDPNLLRRLILVYIYLTMTVGSRAGVSFLLDATEENRIGRDPECAIALSDPLCSRVHAIVEQADGGWRIRDAGSRNGTFVNGQKIDDAMLADGHGVRVGSTEFEFRLTEQPPTVDSESDNAVTETVIKNRQVAGLSADDDALAATFRRPTRPRIAAALPAQHQAAGL